MGSLTGYALYLDGIQFVTVCLCFDLLRLD